MSQQVITLSAPVPWFTAVGIGIAVIALLITIRNFRRKSGILIRGTFGVCSTVECEDEYVRSVTLENLKDRAVTIFGIYLRLGPNCYIELENRDETPLILKAFETYKKEYGSVIFHSANCRRVVVNDLFKDKEVKRRLVLATTDGKYVVPSKFPYWSPITDFFKNHLTVPVVPLRRTHKGKEIGGNAVFIVDLITNSGVEQSVHLRRDQSSQAAFHGFNIPAAALASKDALVSFLDQEKAAGNFSCSTFEVHDLASLRDRLDPEFRQEPIKPLKISSFTYHVLGRFATWRLVRALHKQNRKKYNGRRA